MSRINEGLLQPSDRSRIKAIIQTHHRPENIESLRTPKLNAPLQISDVGAKRRDRYFGLLQEQVGCTLKIVSNLMSEVKRGKMDRRKMYEQLSDATRLLLASHKDISQQRRESLRPALNKDYRVICTAQQNAKLTSNEFLFGEDLSKRADEALKAKRLANKLTGSNVAKTGTAGVAVIRTGPICSTRARGVDSRSTRTNGNMHTKIGTMEARVMQTDRRERLPPNTRNIHLSGTPALHY